LVTGCGVNSATWDATWRAYLVDNLSIMVNELWQIGVTEVFANGSFVEEKDHPGDIDGYFECDLSYLASRQLHRDLNSLDPYKIWTWNWSMRRPHPDSTKDQLPMWHQYRVELYPHVPGLSSGIPDEFGHPQEFPAAFRKTRTFHRPKGIVKIIR
jgi:hypothetical protein